MEQIKRVEDSANDGLSYFDDEVKMMKRHISAFEEHIKDLVVGHAQVSLLTSKLDPVNGVGCRYVIISTAQTV
jgi:hypothetical protein